MLHEVAVLLWPLHSHAPLRSTSAPPPPPPPPCRTRCSGGRLNGCSGGGLNGCSGGGLNGVRHRGGCPGGGCPGHCSSGLALNRADERGDGGCLPARGQHMLHEVAVLLRPLHPHAPLRSTSAPPPPPPPPCRTRCSGGRLSGCSGGGLNGCSGGGLHGVGHRGG